MLDLARIQYVIENRSETAQSRKRGGVKIHFRPPVARRWGEP
jgi:hypothetical protein